LCWGYWFGFVTCLIFGDLECLSTYLWMIDERFELFGRGFLWGCVEKVGIWSTFVEGVWHRLGV
jgi:hypothetical protein